MTNITLDQPQAMLSEIVRQPQPGEEITITDHEQHRPMNLGSR